MFPLASRLAGAALVLAVLVVAPASADVVRSGSVMPPGNSGHLPQVGDNPWLTDQIPLFERFALKPNVFGQAGTATTPRPGVRIVRGPHGVPAITADTDALLWWGVGFAAAEDRATQLEFFRRGTRGTLAELLPDRIESDIAARRDYYTDAELRAQLRKLPPAVASRFDAYAQGINARLAAFRAAPATQPREFTVVGVPADFTAVDLARIGVQLARTIPSGDGRELANARLLRRVGARRFDALLPIRRADQIPTVPRSAGRFPSQPGRTRADERAGFRASQRLVRRLRLPAEAAAGTRLVTGGSDHWAFRGRRRAFLFSGPQLGFQVPPQLWEFEVHRPGLDARGVSPVGLPVVGIGHNGRIAWGATSGLTDDDDLYVERLAGAERYRFKGRVRRMRCRTERFGILGAAPRVERLCRTVHGPVQARAAGTAYARRYAIWGREIQTLLGVAQLNEADHVGQARAAIRRMTWTENILVADDRGSIGWFHAGAEPLRPRRWDERLPLPGTGEAEWRGLLRWKDHPQVVNPRRGWLANWNNVPSAGWTTGDAAATEQLSGRLHRAALLNRLVAAAAKRPSYAALVAVDREAGTTAQQRPLLTGALRAARRGASGGAAAVLDTVLAWGGSYDTQDAAGRVAPGVAAWEELVQAVTARELSAADRAALGVPGRAHQYDFGYANATAFDRASAADLRAAAAVAAGALERRFASADPAAWRRERRLYEVGVQGLATPPRLEFFDRGTWQQAVELAP